MSPPPAWIQRVASGCEIVREIVAQGTTVLLTTQYMEEADQLADHIAVIDHGRVISQGAPSELKGAIGATELLLTIATDSDLAGAADLLDRAGFANGSVQVDSESRQLRLLANERPHIASELISALSAVGIHVDVLTAQEPSLDQIFLTLTEHTATPDTTSEPSPHGATPVPSRKASRPERHQNDVRLDPGRSVGRSDSAPSAQQRQPPPG